MGYGAHRFWSSLSAFNSGSTKAGLDLFSVPSAPIDVQLRGESDQYATIIGDAADFRSDSLQVRMCR